MWLALKGRLVTDADAPFNQDFSLFFYFSPQVKSTYWQAVKAWRSRTAGNSTSSWTLKGIVVTPFFALLDCISKDAGSAPCSSYEIAFLQLINYTLIASQ